MVEVVVEAKVLGCCLALIAAAKDSWAYFVTIAYLILFFQFTDSNTIVILVSATSVLVLTSCL